ncbi:hypothetical protein ACL6C3_18960 [Capilliphycus salinus ALCB114379]|uniref:hypothetical protein n=1 Tax=Capilliphycus salinus TaxID=2768948 RepID=UPI0039A75F54
MFKAVGSLIVISIVGLSGLPKVARASSAYDIVCEFKYKVGEGSWVYDSTQGTTRAIAKARRRNYLERQEEKASEAGQSFEVIYMFCRDPWGNSSDSD